MLKREQIFFLINLKKLVALKMTLTLIVITIAVTKFWLVKM